MKHKHCELIKAWADGAEIERYSSYHNKWMDCCTPIWLDDVEYRVKPKKKQLWVRPCKCHNSIILIQAANKIDLVTTSLGKWAGSAVLAWEEK